MSKELLFREVFRCIARHSAYLNIPEVSGLFGRLKNKLRNAPRLKSTQDWRKAFSRLLEFESSLRKVEDGKLTARQFEIIWDRSLPAVSTQKQALENNQWVKYTLWSKQEERKLDAFNYPPEVNSPEYLRTQRLAKFFNVATDFARIHNVSPNSVAVRAVLAPFWHQQQKQKQKENQPPCKPRRISVRSCRRRAGQLSFLQVQGVQLRPKGLRRYIAEVNKDRSAALQNLKKQLWITQMYMNDPLDGDNLSEWVSHLKSEQSRILRQFKQMSFKLEVHRRILLRRRDEMQQVSDWRFCRQKENMRRKKTISPTPLLTLNTL